jgi:UDP-glucose 4-epimerase
MKVLVTGGAGYVGSHVARALRESGHEVAVFDNLSEGHRRAARGCVFLKGDLLNARSLDRGLAKFPAEAVVHMAAKCLVGESVEKPGYYWQQNVVGSLALLEAMGRAGVKLIVFSSSAAVYGQPDRELIDEAAPKAPCNPYGTTKLVFEHALADHSAGGLLRYAALRYFNAAGAHSSGKIGEDHPVETHLIPNLLTAALSGGAKPLKIFGTDYPTPDGTAVRDYVHVEDLARAHVKALEYLAGGGASIAMNLGTGRGSSILEVLAAAKKVTGRDFPTENSPRRAGDPARLVASNALAGEKLGWKPERSLEDIIASAWKWHSKHPQGYGDR